MKVTPSDSETAARLTEHFFLVAQAMTDFNTLKFFSFCMLWDAFFVQQCHVFIFQPAWTQLRMRECEHVSNVVHH